jgi:GntR family transcriptional regulator/MocR family aminotransferase
MHLTVRLDVPLSDVEIAESALTKGIVVAPVSRYCLPSADASRYNGFVLGYAGVPAEKMDGLVAQLAQVIGNKLEAQRQAGLAPRRYSAGDLPTSLRKSRVK